MNKSRYHILFYISSHGFGHSTRMIEVANHIPLPHKVTFATMAPYWLYDINSRRPFYFRKVSIDAGVIQKDFLTVLPEETLKKYEDIYIRREEIIKSESKWIKENSVDIIVSDIPSLAFPIACISGIPSVGIGNFSWDWIYEPMVKEYPRYTYLVDSIKEDYSKAGLLLRLPVNGDMSIFPYIKDIPFIGRKSNLTYSEIRNKLGIPQDKKIVLLSLGGYEIGNIDFSEIARELKDFVFVTFNPDVPSVYNNLIVVNNRGDLLHEDILAEADLVICKPGYSTLSECIANRTKVLFTQRKNYIENEVLVEGLYNYTVSEEIPPEDFLKGNWKSYIYKLLERDETWPDSDCSGPSYAVEEIFNILEKKVE